MTFREQYQQYENKVGGFPNSWGYENWLERRVAELTEERDRWKQHYEYSMADSARLDYIRLYQTDPVAIRFALKASAEEVFRALKEEQKP